MRALWFEEFFDGGLLPPMSTIYFQQFFNPRFKNKPTDHTLLDEAVHKKLPPLLAYAEEQIAQCSGQWITGEQFTVADIALTVAFSQLRMAGYTLDAAQYPHYAAYVARAEARPSSRKVTAAMQDFLKTLTPKG